MDNTVELPDRESDTNSSKTYETEMLAWLPIMVVS